MNKVSLITSTNDEIVAPVDPSDKEGRLDNRARIEGYLLAGQKAFGSERGDMDVINQEGLVEYFVDGAYIRELSAKAGFTMVSELWNRERMWVLLEGEVTVTSELGRQRIKAPYLGMAPYGSRVAVYVHEDTRWLAITGAESTNSEDVLEEVRAKDYSEITYPWDLLEDKSGEEL